VVINHPKDSVFREQLFGSLTEVVDPAFYETDQTRKDSLNNQLQQSYVWGAIVRLRIQISRHAGSASSIVHPSRHLQHALDALLKELGSPASPGALSGNRRADTRGVRINRLKSRGSP
jgi:hypothetical protein